MSTPPPNLLNLEFLPRAVIFDFWGTLVSYFTTQTAYREHTARVAASLALDTAAFTTFWRATWHRRATGALATTEEALALAVKELQSTATIDDISRATAMRREFTKSVMQPRPDAISTLERIRALGLPIGLISDCSAEVPALWETSPFAPLIDAPVLSAAVGLKKPDFKIYDLCATRLGIPRSACLFVGDGDSRELSGANAAGMAALKLTVPGEEKSDAAHYETDDWSGPSIPSLSYVADLVETRLRLKGKTS